MLKRKDESDKILLIGCGHARRLSLSSHSHPEHPAPNFITVDIIPSVKPDVVGDISESEALRKKLDYKKFPSVMFEYVPETAIRNLDAFQELLINEGYSIFIGSGFGNLKNLPNGQPIWTAHHSKSLDHCVILIPSSDDKRSEIQLNPIVKKYLSTYLESKHPEKLMHLSHMTPEYKTFSEKSKELPLYVGKISSSIESLALEKFLQEGAPKGPPDIKEIKALIKSYTPGKMRQFFSGKTSGMKELVSFLEEKNDNLSQEDLLQILAIIQKRESRMSGKDITRSSVGETTRIFHLLGALIINYFSNNIEEIFITKKPESISSFNS